MVTEGRFRANAAVALLLTLVSTATAKYSGGSGTAQDPYQMATAADLIGLGETPADYDKHFILIADIDLDPNLPGRKVFDKAVIAPDTDPVKDNYDPHQGPSFTGVFDGHGHMISHLTITGGSHLGLFGRLASGAEVKDLGVVDVNVTGSGGYVSGLVGSNGDFWTAKSGTVTRCYSTGAVRGKTHVGGLVANNTGSVIQCWSTGTISGNAGVGGLVGGNGGALTRCYVAGAVSGHEAVGGLAGSSGSGLGGKPVPQLTDCWNTAAVHGDEGVGGLVGWSGGILSVGADLTRCYNTGAVAGINGIGGLAGVNDWGTVTQCYNTGAVSGNSRVGGLVGGNGGPITDCYSMGPVSGGENVGGLVGANEDDVVGSFWDTQTSGQVKSAGGTGKTTAQMQTVSTFMAAGWDFVGETANGTADIWWILEGKDYPRLARRAFDPGPCDGATDVLQTMVLNWAPGERLLRHDVYLGLDKELVANATTKTLDVYRGRYPPQVTTYGPGALEWNRTYYWRIDEVSEADPNSPWKGSIWSFTTADYVVASVVDDFEKYTDDDEAGQAIFQTWIDGLGDEGNGTGAVVGNIAAPFAEEQIVRGGGQSMPMDYNDVKKPWYSEAQRSWPTAQNWTTGGADTLTLYFRGKSDNSREPLYVGIEDSVGRMAVMVHSDPPAVLATDWQKWHIPFADLRAAGVDVAAVKKMVIGVGDRQNPKLGGTGRIYVDDIRLTKRMP